MNCSNCTYWDNPLREDKHIKDWRFVEENLAEGFCDLKGEMKSPYDECDEGVKMK